MLCTSEYHLLAQMLQIYSTILIKFNHTTGGYLEIMAATQCQTSKCICSTHVHKNNSL